MFNTISQDQAYEEIHRRASAEEDAKRLRDEFDRFLAFADTHGLENLIREHMGEIVAYEFGIRVREGDRAVRGA
jgi:hypothetical protein